MPPHTRTPQAIDMRAITIQRVIIDMVIASLIFVFADDAEEILLFMAGYCLILSHACRPCQKWPCTSTHGYYFYNFTRHPMNISLFI